MGPVTASTIVDAPRERVFDLVCDLSARLAYTDHFVSGYHLQRIEPVGVGAGARFRVEPPLNGMWMETVIVEVERPIRVVERGHGGRDDRIELHTAWELLEGTGRATAVRLAFWTEPHNGADRVREHLGGRRWWSRSWSRALQRLKEIAEQGAAAERVGVGGAGRVRIT